MAHVFDLIYVGQNVRGPINIININNNEHNTIDQMKTMILT